jgi:carbon-monoxide dehydrogenase large subunit
MNMQFGIGQSVRRKEDPKFLTGRGRYVSDMALARQSYAVFLYSPHAHADIKSIDTSGAEAAPGVIAVLTGADYVGDGMGPTGGVMPEDMGGPPGHRTMHMPLAVDRVRFVGERVAVVIAESSDQARDAAEHVIIDYADLPAVVMAADAVKDGAPLVHDEADNNVSFTLRLGNGDETDAAIKGAHHVTRIKLHNNRLNAMTMEPRGCLGEFDTSTGRLTFYTSTQNVHGIRQGLAAQNLNVPESMIRVVAKDVGGGFGMKGHVYPEEAIVAWACKRVERPVKWIATRSEAMMGDDHGRDQTVEAELALDENGKFVALRWHALHNVGAYIEGAGAIPVLFAVKLAPTVYNIPNVDVINKAVFSNTSPTVPYRGAGRPEAVYIMERIIDAAARETGIDRAELRRINFIKPDEMPHSTLTGWTYDTGDYATALDKARGIADWDGYEARKATTEAKGLKRGLGLVYYVDNTGIFNERMEIRFDPSGTITIVSGVLSHGQGHETSFSQMLAEWLNVPIEDVRLAQADTDEVAIGRGTYASRSMMVGGSALRAAADEVIERGKKFAAHFMESDAADIEFSDGKFTIAGTDKEMSLKQVAQMSFMPVHVPSELGVGLQGVGAFAAEVPSVPNGCHIGEVEIDPDTGAVRIDRYTVVDDIGTVINPLLAQAQIHGGVVQGVGQALLEDVAYDPENGQLLAGSLMDYGVPRADLMPEINVDFSPVFSKSNPLGAKGVGEGGTVAGTPTIVNAVLDALADCGVREIDTPVTPKRIWQAIQQSGS